jgi:hypothetical protein
MNSYGGTVVVQPLEPDHAKELLGDVQDNDQHEDSE